MKRTMPARLLVASLLLAGSAAVTHGQNAANDLAHALAHLQAGENEDALAVLEPLVGSLAAENDRSPELAEAYAYVGAAYLGLGNEPAADSYLREAWRLDQTVQRHCERLPEGARAFCLNHRPAVAGELLAAEPAAPASEAPATQALTPAAPEQEAAHTSSPPSPGPPGGAAPALKTKKKGGGGGWPVLTVLAAGGAGAGVGVWQAHRSDSSSETTSTVTLAATARDRDDDGDGFSENQGDCDDTNRNIRPGGAVVVSGAFSELEGRLISCRTRDYVTIVLTNFSCRTVTVRRIQLNDNPTSGRCSPGAMVVPISISQVGPGESRAIANASAASPTTGVGCCPGGSCLPVACVIDRYVTVETDAGTFHPAGYGMRIEMQECARCASTLDDGSVRVNDQDGW